jgi:propionyl-CoA carboxylase alpha chain
VIAKLLVANRGEIALRVLRAARGMGIATVAVFSDPDADALFVAEADEAVPLGGVTPAASYLRVDAVLEAAERTGADAVHPGYGFLAEHPELAAGCRKRGVTFVGPPPEVLAVLGDKVEAKRVMAAAGLPVLPGAEVTGLDGEELAAAAERVGLPVMVKATFGGGGIGMRVVRDPAELQSAVDAARRPAGAAFGDDAVFLERLLQAPRHVEVQVLADAHGRVVHLFERECSVQRRHQKLVEEAPSPAVGRELRRRLGEAAVAAAEAVGYVGAGTVEFLLAPPGASGGPRGGPPEDQGGFWFLEVNARIQVEHPVTEAVTGLDLVRLQLLVAAGEPLPEEVVHAELRGHAVEARLYAEDPGRGFLPQAGTLHRFRVTHPGVRVDAGVADGSVVGVHYDPLLAKVIAHAPTRAEAAGLLAAALDGARVHGVTTNRDLLVGVLRHPEFLAGEVDTGFLERHPPAELAAGRRDPEAGRLHAAAAALAAQAARRAAATVQATIPSGWRNNPSQLQRVDFAGEDGVLAVGYRFGRAGALEALEVDGEPLPGARLWACHPQLVDLEVAGVRRGFEVHRVGEVHYVDGPLGHAELRERPRFPEPAEGSGEPRGGAPVDRPEGSGEPQGGAPVDQAGGAAAAPGSLASPLPGIVRRVAVRPGEPVAAGALLVVVEAMKLEHRISAPAGGRVRELLVAEGQEVDAGTPVAVLEEAGDG